MVRVLTVPFQVASAPEKFCSAISNVEAIAVVPGYFGSVSTRRYHTRLSSEQCGRLKVYHGCDQSNTLYERLNLTDRFFHTEGGSHDPPAGNTEVCAFDFRSLSFLLFTFSGCGRCSTFSGNRLDCLCGGPMLLRAIFLQLQPTMLHPV